MREKIKWTAMLGLMNTARMTFWAIMCYDRLSNTIYYRQISLYNKRANI